MAGKSARQTRNEGQNRTASINLRIEPSTRDLIDAAAGVLGKSRTEFMLDSARRDAVDTLLDQRLFVLEADRFDAFVAALDRPPAPNAKLKALMKRRPAWDR